jgi:enoyl-CoA hydratase/carnithine racemase
VLFQRLNDHVALVTLNRPDKRNAVNGDVARGLSAAIAEIESDSNLRVAILAANGAVFCAGADLSEVAAGRAQELSTPEGGFAGFVRAARKKPWIAAIAGTAVGGGCELALACDLVVAGEQAQLGLPEVKRGLFAGAGGAFRIARALPRAVAVELALTGRPMPAQEALAHGLVNRVVPTEELMAAATALANEIAANAPLSVQGTLQVVRNANDFSEEELWQQSAAVGQALMNSEDAKEGPRAFLEKRAPRWTGR